MSPEYRGIFQLSKEVIMSVIYHCSAASVRGNFTHHSPAFSGLQSTELSMILETLEYI
jgi:hypothetical protein